MPDAKISINTEAKNEGLEKLNRALAEGQQEVEAMTRELKDLKKATQDGTQATKEQAAAMVKLRQDINAQKAANKEYSSEISKTTAEIKKSVKAMADGDKGARGLASAFKMTEGFTTAFSVALGGLAASITAGVVSALGDMANQVISLGAQMQQSVAHLAAMTGGADTATEAYRALNDVYRNTNFDEPAVFNMGEQLMRMGYSAQNAAGLIQLCADAAAGLGTGQQGAQQLVDAISRMQAVYPRFSGYCSTVVIGKMLLTVLILPKPQTEKSWGIFTPMDPRWRISCKAIASEKQKIPVTRGVIFLISSQSARGLISQVGIMISRFSGVRIPAPRRVSMNPERREFKDSA